MRKASFSTIIKILIFLLPVFNSAYAWRGYQEWKNPVPNVQDLNINNLRFTNRASCALDSKKPTESAFIIVNNMDAAKGIYRLAKATGNNTTELTEMGIKVYRYTVIQLLQYIHRKLVNKDLPLLPFDLTARRGLPFRYKNISRGCKNDEYCTDLDEYIDEVWKASNVRTNDVSYQLSKVDKYDSKRNFLSSKNYIDKKTNENLTCHFLKKFSPIQAHLYGTKPDSKVFAQLAESNINRDEYITDCYDMDAQKNLTVAAYQIELNSLKEKYWNRQGFDYWNSLKLYFSWAWRNAPEFEKMAAPFGKVLRAVELENSV